MHLCMYKHLLGNLREKDAVGENIEVKKKPFMKLYSAVLCRLELGERERGNGDRAEPRR